LAAAIGRGRAAIVDLSFLLASALARRGLLEEAREAAAAGLAIDPSSTVRRMRDSAPAKRGEVLAQREPMLLGMREAGLAEQS
jgi:hypothetical protein